VLAYRDGGHSAANHLAGVAVLVNLAEANPLAKLLTVVNLHQVDAVLGAERLNQGDDVRLLAVGGQDAKVGLPPEKWVGGGRHGGRRG
jgi:hypothetical protein